MTTVIETQRKLPFSVIRSLVETYYDFQHQRIITSNRIFGNVEQKNITEEDLKEFGVDALFKKAESFETDIKTILTKEIKKHDIYSEYLIHVYGIGTIITSGLIAYIEDVKKFDNISKLWQYSGFGMNTFCPKCDHPTYQIIEIVKRDKKTTKAKRQKPFKICPDCDGETITVRQRRYSGYQSNWNDKFKVLCWKIGQSFLKQKAEKSGYRKLYDQYKLELRRKFPERIKIDGKVKYNDGHIHNMALRKVAKIFLAHVWLKWREIKGLSTDLPYSLTVLGHTGIIKPIIDR